MSENLTPDELAARLRTSRWTLWRWRRDGKGPPWFLSGRTILYRKADVDAWEAAQVAASQS